MNSIDIRTKLSVLWIFILMNLIFRDLHEFASKDFLEEALTGHVNGVKITEGLMLFGGVLAEIPIAMVVLSLVLKKKLNRIFNLISGIIILAFLIFNIQTADTDDFFFLFFEIVASIFILWTAFKWESNKAYPYPN